MPRITDEEAERVAKWRTRRIRERALRQIGEPKALSPKRLFSLICLLLVAVVLVRAISTLMIPFIIVLVAFGVYYCYKRW